MDALTVIFIVVFGVGAVIPAVWSIIGMIKGDTSKFWPGVFGTIWAVALLTATFIGIGTKWGGCPPGSASSDGAIKCYKKVTDDKEACEPDIWKLECKSISKPKCAGVDIPAKAYCPAGYHTVYSFCEPIEWDAAVKQPWATWSDLSFVAAGLWLLWFLHFYEKTETTRMAGNPPVDNPMLMIGWLSVVYGLIVIFMGPPSQWYHASMKDWAGWFDTMSVVVWLMFNAVYVIYSLVTMWGKGRQTERTIIVLSIWFLLVLICGFVATAPKARTPLYFVAGIPWGVGELIYIICGLACKKIKFRRNLWLIGINAFLLGGTMFLWGWFNDSMAGTGCIGRSWFPGHAVFHILASFSTVLTFFSFSTERQYTPSP